jgi:SAM-dependent methyltransferase
MDGCGVDWSSVSPEWDRCRDFVEQMKADLTPRLLAALDLRPGQRALELGAGTGELAARIAAAVAPGGSVVASDLAPGMVNLLKARLDGLDGVEVAEIDARDIPLPTAGVDAVAFRMGLMLVPDPSVAVREIERVLRPGGRVAAAVWAAQQHNPWLSTLGMAAMMHGVVQGGPPVGPGMPFSLADPEMLGGLFRTAAFDDVSVDEVDGVAVYADVDEYMSTAGALAPPLAAALRSAGTDDLARVRASAGEALERFRGPGGLRVPSRALLATARRR